MTAAIPAARGPSFDGAQQATCAENQPRWSESGRLGQKWRQTMRDYVLPKIGAVPVDVIEAHHVKRVLAPIAAVLQKAEAQARTPPATRLARRLLVLTASRSREIRLRDWADVDIDAATRTRPAGKMKAGKAHRVPLSRQALEVLQHAGKLRGAAATCSPPRTGGGMLPDSAMRHLVARLDVNATPHGFRSSFKDWARNHDVDETPSEFGLAYVEGSATERGYPHDDLLDKRRHAGLGRLRRREPGAPVSPERLRRNRDTALALRREA